MFRDEEAGQPEEQSERVEDVLVAGQPQAEGAGGAAFHRGERFPGPDSQIDSRVERQQGKQNFRPPAPREEDGHGYDPEHVIHHPRTSGDVHVLGAERHAGPDFRPLAGSTLDLQRAVQRLQALAQVPQPHAGGPARGIEPLPIVAEPEEQGRISFLLDLAELHVHRIRAGVLGDVREGLLRDPEEVFPGARRQLFVRREVPDFEVDRNAAAITQRLALLAQGLDQPDRRQRLGAQLAQHRLHLDHGRVSALADIHERGPGGARISLPTLFGGCGAELDAEDLLLDRVVQVPRQPVSLLLRGRPLHGIPPAPARRRGVEDAPNDDQKAQRNRPGDDPGCPFVTSQGQRQRKPGEHQRHGDELRNVPPGVPDMEVRGHPHRHAHAEEEQSHEPQELLCAGFHREGGHLPNDAEAEAETEQGRECGVGQQQGSDEALRMFIGSPPERG